MNIATTLKMMTNTKNDVRSRCGFDSIIDHGVAVFYPNFSESNGLRIS